MGVKGRENYGEYRKLHQELLEIKEEVGARKWIIMGDLNAHIGLNNERLNVNGQMLLNFEEETQMKVMNWQLENPITWRDRGTKSAIDYKMINERVLKNWCKVWKNEDADISDHLVIDIKCGKTEVSKESTLKV